MDYCYYTEGNMNLESELTDFMEVIAFKIDPEGGYDFGWELEKWVFQCSQNSPGKKSKQGGLCLCGE